MESVQDWRLLLLLGLPYSRINRMVMDAANVDAVIGICSARHSSTFIRERDDLIELKKNADKPVVLCSYTLPREGSVEIVNRCGLPLYTNMRNCARALREMANYRALRERFLKRPNISTEASRAGVFGGARPPPGLRIRCGAGCLGVESDRGTPSSYRPGRRCCCGRVPAAACSSCRRRDVSVLHHHGRNWKVNVGVASCGGAPLETVRQYIEDQRIPPSEKSIKQYLQEKDRKGKKSRVQSQLP